MDLNVDDPFSNSNLRELLRTFSNAFIEIDITSLFDGDKRLRDDWIRKVSSTKASYFDMNERKVIQVDASSGAGDTLALMIIFNEVPDGVGILDPILRKMVEIYYPHLKRIGEEFFGNISFLFVSAIEKLYTSNDLLIMVLGALMQKNIDSFCNLLNDNK